MAAIFAGDDEQGADAAIAALRAGEAVVVPTDTVYGVAVALSSPGATKLLFALKDRPEQVPIAVLVGSVAQALELVEPLPAPVARLVDTLWPGPLTVVLRRRADAHAEIGGDGGTVGVRCPDHAFLGRLLAAVGPLATTRANRHGAPTPDTAAAAAAALAGEVAVVIDGGPCRGVASTVVDGTDSELSVLRAGPISPEQVRAAALP
jgi:tRNA threonylcarbamoyl adenosine modification protein (Sua5/YciO/YrdC/YwlC family)